ncbi:MAG: hypothetical protein HY788_12690 [Deltaproteobacteria bacterium]|nr:hypothetical protein [Deltaproteobacteria bacterium]
MKCSILPLFFCVMVALTFLSLPISAPAFTAEDIAQLKEHGVDDETLKILIDRQADLLGIVTVSGIIRMKESGVGNDVLRVLVSAPEPRKRVRTYGTQLMRPLRSITAQDLIRLKQSGFGDDLLRAVIEIQQRDLWPVLVDLGVIACDGYR